jgi:cyclophilin family peptidyl-prolyl cis-trans isomerase
LSSNTTVTKLFDANILDDPLWLPTGSEHRTNADDVKRYPAGVLTHAGGGPNTRSNQFVLTLKPNKFMGGGSPWEVPMGEVVSEMQILQQFYVGYGEKGPSQRILRREGVTESVRSNFPLMDYINNCQIIDEAIEEKRPE